MTYKNFRIVLLSFVLFAPLWAEAQDSGSNLALSTDEAIYWCRICSAVPGMENYAMTDLNGAGAESEDLDDALRMAIFVLPTETEDFRSQWKLTAGEDGKVILTNRSTGFQISNHSRQSDKQNATWLTASADAPGFIVTSLGNEAFKLESVEDDGVNRSLAVVEKGSEALSYPESDESTSAIGWKFFPVEIETAIGSAKTDGTATIRAKERRILVSGCSEWQLFNASGEEMPRTTALPTGIYMVKMPQRTVKVAIP